MEESAIRARLKKRKLMVVPKNPYKFSNRSYGLLHFYSGKSVSYGLVILSFYFDL